MKRHELMETALGKRAFVFYNLWMEKKKRRVLTPDAFRNSRYFNAFIKFATLVKRTNVPRPENYIWFMIENNFQPEMWTMGEVFIKYLEFLDNIVDPYDRVIDTINTYEKLSKKYGCKRNEIFDHVSSSEIIHHITTRELSPWMLLHSSNFVRYLRNCDETTKVQLSSVIREDYWKRKFTQNKEVSNNIRDLAKRLKL